MSEYRKALIDYIENWLNTGLKFSQYLQLRGIKCIDN